MTWSTGRILERRQWAPGLVTIRLDADVDHFEPGQFLNVGLRIDEKLVFRAYSAASPPGEPLEFYLAEVAGGELTPTLFSLKEGDEVEVERHPQGFFTLKYVPDASELWLIATGTGLGPFLSILRAGEVWRRFPHVVVVHGVRQCAHLGYKELLGELVERHAGRLTYVPVVSREPEASGVVHGRVTTALTDGSLEAFAQRSITPERSHLMLCGNPAMIEEMLRLLEARGLRKHRQRKPGHITIEKYW